ncbi:hypothetical protein [Massilia mucilaginosa]|uniref:hypothetical protein n=1 Tax=Massilia mucilaginosa TaxID=2609282 RepID=UPI001E4D973F|nr:hypothetical protein [Massilia mucilaginosa]
MKRRSFLAADAHAATGQVFEQPGVVRIEARGGVTLDPAVPGNAGRHTRRRRLVFGHFGVPGEAEGGEAEARALAQAGAAAVVKADVGDVAVASWPGQRIVEAGPDLGRAQAGHDDVVGNVVVGGAGQIA